MNVFSKIVFVALFTASAGYVKAAGGETHTGNNNADTTVGIKSNIVIFKMITNSIINSTGNSSGSLKKAGKVARTSNSSSSSKNIVVGNEG